MKRLQLFELEDQAWFPAAFRNAIRRYLAAAWSVTPLPGIWAKLLDEVLVETGRDRIVDLGSGAGGPAPIILRELRKFGRPVRLILTDLYPDLRSGVQKAEAGIEYWPEPVNAAQVPAQLTGVRTMFASFHHFPPALAEGILQNAFLRREPICVFEMTSRTLVSAVSTLLVPLAVLAITPKVRPRSIFQLLFTYLIPLLPLMVFWDTLMSQLRTYSPQDLRRMTADLAASDYRWECRQVRVLHFPSPVPYLVGVPLNTDKQKALPAGLEAPFCSARTIAS